MTKSVKIPKKIAGVKLPKQARKTANKAIRMGAGPVMREIAVAAIAAGGARGERKAPPAGDHGHGGRAHIHIDAGKVGEAFRNAAIDGLRRFLEGFEEGLRDIAEQAAPDGGPARPATGPRPGAARD